MSPRSLLAAALGLALVGWLVARAGPAEVWHRLATFPPGTAAGVAAGQVLVALLAAASLLLLFPARVPVRSFLARHFLLWLYSLVLPRGLVYGGGMLLWATGHGLSPGAFLALLAADRVVGMAAMGLLALPVLPAVAARPHLAWVAAALAAALLVLSRLAPVRRGMGDGAAALLDLVRRRPGRLAACAVVVLARGVVSGLVVTLAVRGAGGQVGWMEGVVLATAASLAGYVPLSPNGLGTVEAAATLLYGAAGVEAAAVVAAYAVARLLWIPAAGLPALALSLPERRCGAGPSAPGPSSPER